MSGNGVVQHSAAPASARAHAPHCGPRAGIQGEPEPFGAQDVVQLDVSQTRLDPNIEILGGIACVCVCVCVCVRVCLGQLW